MASLFKRGATWWVAWTRTERETLGTKDKQAAEIKLRRRERERADPAYAAATKATVEGCLKTLREDRNARGRAAGGGR